MAHKIKVQLFLKGQGETAKQTNPTFSRYAWSTYGVSQFIVREEKSHEIIVTDLRENIQPCFSTWIEGIYITGNGLCAFLLSLMSRR